MGVRKLFSGCAVAAVLLLAAFPVLAGGPQVVSFLAESIPVYDLDHDSFKRVKKVSAKEMPGLPMTVCKMSSRGYVFVKSKGQGMWLDMMDVEISPRLKASNCYSSPAGSKKSHITVVSGLGGD